MEGGFDGGLEVGGDLRRRAADLLCGRGDCGGGSVVGVVWGGLMVVSGVAWPSWGGCRDPLWWLRGMGSGEWL